MDRPGRGRGTLRSLSSLLGPLERQPAVIFLAVEIGLGERGAAHEDRLGAFGAVVIPAEGEGPGGAGAGLAAGRGERGPGDPGLDGPAPICVARLVKRAVDHGNGLRA